MTDDNPTKYGPTVPSTPLQIQNAYDRLAALSPAERAALIGEAQPIRRHFELGQPDCTGGPDCPVPEHASGR